MAQPAQWFSGGIFVPHGRWTAQRALAELPEVAESTIEVFDGSLVVSPRPGGGHQRALRVLLLAMDPAARVVGLEAMPEINLVLGHDLASPDITLVPRVENPGVWFDASEAAMVVEIMSPNHKRKDRIERPDVYARNGIPYFMRVEFRGNDPVIFLHRLTEDGEYRPIVSAPAGKAFTMAEPFAFEIDPVELLDR
jgi:Uma2 family endonuclease